MSKYLMTFHAITFVILILSCNPGWSAPPDYPSFQRLLGESTDIIIGRVDSVKKTEEESVITQDGMSEFIYYHYEATVTVSRSIRGGWKEEETITVRLRMEQDQRYMEVLLREGEYGLLFLKRQGDDDPSRILTNKSNGVLPFFEQKIEFDSGKPVTETILSLLVDELRHAHETGNTDRITSLIGWSEFVQADLPLPLLRTIRESEDPDSITPALIYLVGKGDKQACHHAAKLALEVGRRDADTFRKHPNVHQGLISDLANTFMRNEKHIPDNLLSDFLHSPIRTLNVAALLRFSRTKSKHAIPEIYLYLARLDPEDQFSRSVVNHLERIIDHRFADEERNLPLLINTCLDWLETHYQIPDEYKEKRRSLQPDPPPKSAHEHDNPVQ